MRVDQRRKGKLIGEQVAIKEKIKAEMLGIFHLLVQGLILFHLDVSDNEL